MKDQEYFKLFEERDKLNKACKKMERDNKESCHGTHTWYLGVIQETKISQAKNLK